MKKSSRLTSLLTIPATALAFALPTAHAEELSVSANLGFMSDYFFRGVFQADSVANGGIDVEWGNFSGGTWAADVDDGLEVDVYFGYSQEFDGGFTLGGGFTGYYYTGDFDDTYRELNLNAGWNMLTLDFALGEYDNFGGPTQDYTFLSLTGEYEGFYGTFGTFGNDADGEYLEVGYGTEIGGFDVGGALVFNDSDLSNTGQGDESFVFSISKSFDL